MRPVKGRELARALERRGWTIARVQGSHHIYTHPDSPARISIPIHGNKPLKQGLAAHLMKAAGITPSDL